MLTEEQLKNTPFTCDISNKEYHKSPGISNSGIGLILDCPLRYWDKHINPDKPENEETPSMRFGEMVHCFLLEPEEFSKRYFVGSKTRKGTKACDELLAISGNRKIIDTEEQDILYKILNAVNEHKFAKHLLKNGRAEQSIYWTDADTGVLCKSRPDYMTNDYIVDIKTTRCASWSDFSKSIVNYGYHRQAAMALAAKENISGLSHTNFINLCIEVERPFIVSVFVMDDDAIKQGRAEFKRGLEIYKQCKETNIWPAYVDEIEEISLPTWAIKK